MPTVAELLKSANITDEVIAGLPADVTKVFETHLASAETSLKTAAEKEAAAAEAFRLAGLEKKEITAYVDRYGMSLTQLANEQAKNKALTTYLESLKTQGFEIEIPSGTSAAAKEEKTVTFDPDKFKSQVGDVLAQFLDANNEHIRLFGVPLPDSSQSIADEAARARKPLREYVAEKYKFSAKREEMSAASAKTREDAIRKEEREKVEHEVAERYGSNPHLRAGESSRNSLVPKIKSDDFQKASGNLPRKARESRLLDNLHKDLAAAKSA